MHDQTLPFCVLFSLTYSFRRSQSVPAKARSSRNESPIKKTALRRSQSVPAKARSGRNDSPVVETGFSRNRRKPAPVGANPTQLGGGLSRGNEPLLEFHTTPTTHRQRWRNVVNKQTFRASLEQNREASTNDDLGLEVTGALYRAIDREITRDTSLTPHSTVHFVMNSDHFNHAFQSTTFTVQEFRQGSERLDVYLQSLADKLNSNQEFTPDDTFSMEMTLIHTPAPGSSNGNKYKPGRKAVEKLLESKQTVVRINNEDDLCCARAIVTMQAWCHKADNVNGFRNYDNLRRGRPLQTRLAEALHMQASVPMGPCGIQVNSITTV